MKTIILDLNGTIVPNVEFKQFFEKNFGQTFEVPYGEIKKMLIGKLSVNDFWHQIAEIYKIDISDKVKIDFNNLAYEEMILSKDRIDFLKSISEKYNLILLSNTIPNVELFIEKHNFNQYFDVVILSHLVGYKKPEREIFELAIKRAKYQGIIYFDDIEINCIEAEKLGIKSVLVDDYKDLELLFAKYNL